jgi:hypothetical protein
MMKANGKQNVENQTIRDENVAVENNDRGLTLTVNQRVLGSSPRGGAL